MRRLFLFCFILFSCQALFSQDLFVEPEAPLSSNKENLVNVSCLKIDSIVEFALSKTGSRYKYGSDGPNHFDCSGLMCYTFRNFGIALQRSSRDQFTMGIPVKKKDIRRGDLVFFKRGKEIGHVGLVTEVDSNGNFRFVHSSSQKYGVRVDHSQQEYYANTYMGARRLLDCSDENSAEAPANGITAGEQEIAVQPDKDRKSIQHKVKKGDTLYAIARKYRTSVDDIKQWNDLSSNDLQINQRLKIYP